MPLVLAEGFGLFYADLRASAGAPLGLAVQVFIDPVLAQQPFTLAGMAGEHLPLGLEHARDFDEKVGRDGLPLAVGTLESINKVKMRDCRERWCRLPLAGRVVRTRGGETGV